MQVRLIAVRDDGTRRAPDVPDPRRTLEIVAGTDVQLDVHVVTPDGAPVDLTGCRLLLTVKRRPHDELPLLQVIAAPAPVDATVVLSAQLPDAVRSCPITRPLDGVAPITLLGSDTMRCDMQPGRYVWDLWLLAGDSTREPVIQLSALVLQPAVAPLDRMA